MEISALANEELLAVFSYLTPEELLQCRAVCHRWASLAQDPTLWSGQHVDSRKCNLKLLTAILRFAPCLGSLVSFWKDPISPLWRSTLLSTGCAISRLHFAISTADAFDAALVISRQASLGRLKVLNLAVTETDTPHSLDWNRSLHGLLMQISHTEGLEEMYFNTDGCMDGAVAEFVQRMGRVSAAQVPSFLKRLDINPLDFFGQLLLQWHADTLEDVRTCIPTPNSAQVALLLSRLPRLRILSCTPLDNMRTLLQCPSLKTLQLHVYPIRGSADESRLLETCAYLRVAVSKQLEHLWLSPVLGEDDLHKQQLLCLGGEEGTAVALRSLRLYLHVVPQPARIEEVAAYQQLLSEVLHRLSLLTLLDLDSMPTPALLQALDGRAVPQLTQLLVAGTSQDCGHQFIHSEGLRTLLRNYPRLRVIMKFAQFPDGCGCAFCRKGCHAVPRKA